MSLRKRGSALFLVTLGAGMAGAFAVGGQLRKTPTSVRPIASVRVAEASENGSPVHLPQLTADPDGDGATFETVYDYLQRNFTDPLPTDTKLSLGAVRAMVASLEDPSSYFLTAEQRALLDGENAGKYQGIGAGLFIRPVKKEGYTDYKIVVVAPLPGSPAEKVGLKPGDIITRIDGKYILGYNPMIQYIKVAERFENKAATEDELEKIRQATETKLLTGIGFAPIQLALRGDTSVKSLAKKKSYKLVVERDGKSVTVEVEPGVTEVAPVSSKTLPDGSGYLKIASFTDGTPAQVKSALDALPKGAGLVLDLRNNPGGPFASAQKIAGLLGGSGPFALELAQKQPGKTLTAGPGTKRGRISVLVNRGTASTAEATAQALVENAGAALVGEKTFGDALVQTLYKLGDGSGFTLRTGKLASPRGVSWAWTGLSPKVAIAPGTAEEQVLARATAALRMPIASKGVQP